MKAAFRLNREEVRRAAETAAIGGSGAVLFTLLHIPAGAILGALLFTAAASLAGRQLGWPTAVRNLLYFATGLGAGASVTPDAVRAALIWPLSILALVVATLAMWALGALVFRRMAGVDARTAVFATAPGALSAVMVLAEEQETDVVAVAVAQTLRISTLVAMAPLALSLGHVAPALAHPTPLLAGPLAWVALVAGSLAGYGVARALKWPVPVFLGALMGSALLHGSGAVTVGLPAVAFQVAAAGIGAVIGSRFAGIRVADLMRLLPASLASLVVMALIGAPTGALIGWLIGVGPAAGLMAFAPGSMEMMVAVSLSLNAQPAYVAAHHVVRTLLLLALLPALAARWRRR
jgi:membrane AbrB-like protein